MVLLFRHKAPNSFPCKLQHWLIPAVTWNIAISPMLRRTQPELPVQPRNFPFFHALVWFIAWWSLISPAYCHRLIACNKAQPQKCQTQCRRENHSRGCWWEPFLRVSVLGSVGTLVDQNQDMTTPCLCRASCASPVSEMPVEHARRHTALCQPKENTAPFPLTAQPQPALTAEVDFRNSCWSCVGLIQATEPWCCSWGEWEQISAALGVPGHCQQLELSGVWSITSALVPSALAQSSRSSEHIFMEHHLQGANFSREHHLKATRGLELIILKVFSNFNDSVILFLLPPEVFWIKHWL